MEVMWFFYGDGVAHHTTYNACSTLQYDMDRFSTWIPQCLYIPWYYTNTLNLGSIRCPLLFHNPLATAVAMMRLFSFALTGSLRLTLDSLFMFLNRECLIRIVVRGLWVLLWHLIDSPLQQNCEQEAIKHTCELKSSHKFHIQIAGKPRQAPLSRPVWLHIVLHRIPANELDVVLAP